MRRIVNWYNGSLDNNLDTNNEFNLSQSRDLTVIGNGNIFCDLTRILLKDPASIEHFDLPSSVIEVLKSSNLKNI